ncbi:hypothetical protein LF817_14465 [Halobacillus sp. A1]|uniref:hypothetical protein n=1 Tax=Halobacillus sp. A1 TaxID=2880262 RepID=UPI0020A69496|nr:hypothetical protein [Halobacillus sp. A1]MCP3032528.1 hypothetical protein [Halobacillus sp. A1]
MADKLVVSGEIHYKHHSIDFEVKYKHEDISEGDIKSEEAKQGLIHAINRKFRVKYPLSSTIEKVRVRNF